MPCTREIATKTNPGTHFKPFFTHRVTDRCIFKENADDMQMINIITMTSVMMMIEKQNANQQMCRFWHDFNNLT